MSKVRLKAACACLLAPFFISPAAATPCGGLGDPIEHGCVYDDPEVHNRKEIEWLLRSREDAWNGGDTGLFMLRFKKGDDLRLAYGGTVTKGWQAARDQVRAHFTGAGDGGRLSLPEPEVALLGGNAALVFGRWTLEREGGAAHGLYTVLVRKSGDRWAIVHGHASSD
jgi:hypothetical protein